MWATRRSTYQNVETGLARPCLKKKGYFEATGSSARSRFGLSSRVSFTMYPVIVASENIITRPSSPSFSTFFIRMPSLMAKEYPFCQNAGCSTLLTRMAPDSTSSNTGRSRGDPQRDRRMRPETATPSAFVYAVLRFEACAEMLCQESIRTGVQCQFRSHEWRFSWAISLPSLSSDAIVLKHVVHIESNDASRFSL